MFAFALTVGACRVAPPPVKPAASATSRAIDTRPAFGPTDVDRVLREAWANNGVAPSARCDDAQYLRRAYVDIVGTIPPPEEVTAFLADTSPDKRSRLIDRLLLSPAYADHWAAYWDDVLIGWQTRDETVDRVSFHAWLRDAFAKGMPYNELVARLVSASGRNSNGGPRYGAPAAVASTMATTAMRPPEDEAGNSGTVPVNGAVNWYLKYKDAPQDLAGNASRIFLGVQIQCAQCHDHKTEAWKQDDFRRFASCFARTRLEPIDKGKVVGIRRVDIVDVPHPVVRFTKNPDLAPIALAPPRALDGTDFSRADNTRQALANWITSPNNPWFAKALVNRMWGHFLGRGFVNPIDDLRPSNPATLPELLDHLSNDFAAHDYDLKRLIRTIAATEAYQLSSSRAGLPAASGGTTIGPPAASTNAEPGATNKLWSRFRMTPLGPNELLGAIMTATDVEATLRRSGRANIDQIKFVLFLQYSFLFDVDEEFDETDFEGTVTQALTLLNGALVVGATSSLPVTVLGRLLARPGTDSQKIEALYLRTLSRPPTAEEVDYWTHYVNEPHSDASAPPSPTVPAAEQPDAAASARPTVARRGLDGKKPGKKGFLKGMGGPPEALVRMEERAQELHLDSRHRAYEDLFWALINSSEFVFNH
jgi:hypothetical protein